MATDVCIPNYTNYILTSNLQFTINSKFAPGTSGTPGTLQV